MHKEKMFSPSTSSLFTPFKPSSLIFSQVQPTPETQNPPPQKQANLGSHILKAATSNILQVFQKCNPGFTYTSNLNPKRCLTVPSEGIANNGYDNENNEYILYVNDIIRSPENEEYIILELLGKGTFGQVIKCYRQQKNDSFAVKVIKNKPAYTNQALLEVKTFKKLREENIANEDYIVRLYDYFVFRNHICLVFEMLHVSLYDLLRLSNFSGFSLKFIGRLAEQIIESLVCLERNKIIHCDLKPENVLFADEESDIIKLIDLGSACFLHNTLYTYIQSRFYRAPEIVLGSKYTIKIDSWSLGCMVAEFYLGLPIFPGSSEYDQLRRMIEVLGMPSDDVIEGGRFKNKFFKREGDTYAFKTTEEFEQEQKVQLPPHKKYFILKKLDDLEMYYNKSKQREKQPAEKPKFEIFLHFLKGLLNFDQNKRWTSAQARSHPFLTGMPFEPTWQPLPPQQALEAIERKGTSEQSAEHQKIYDSFNPFNKMDQQQNFNAESYRPYIPPGYGDRKEEAKSQSQNVYLINSQTTSSKPKPKLSLNASTFSTGGAAEPFQLPTLNVDTGKSNLGYKTSHSEPNSARNSDNKHGHKTFAQATLKEENEEENVEGQDNTQGQSNKNYNNGGGNQFNPQYNQQQQQQPPFNPQYNQYNQYNQYPPGFVQGQGQGQGHGQVQGQGQGQFRNPNMQQAQQFYPPQQFGGGYYPPQQQQQQPQNFNTRQRSNSDQGATENIYFQKNYGNQYHYQNQQQQQGQGFQQQEYKRYSTDQGQPMGGQDQMGSYNNSGNKKNQKHKGNWSGKSSGYKNKYNKNYYNQGQQQHDESEELNEK